MRDTIRITGLKLDVEVGFFAAERGVTQRLVADVAVETDFKAGPQDDRRSGFVDYAELERKLRERVTGRKFELIEAVASELSREALTLHPSARVHVRVTKRPLDMPGIDSVSAECVREAKDF
jgi:dihydroneopterin aldolase